MVDRFKQAMFWLLLIFGPWSSVIGRRDDMCKFPTKWEGTWFQSGVRSLITIESNRLSNKGRCLSSDGDKFLVVDDKGVCYRCIVIHEKHINVLQYKETFCHSRNNLYNLCSLITGDALLYSMFRLNAQPVHCPFKPPLTFTYNRGHGECRNPVSNIDGCIEESRLVLRYQACPDVSGTESFVEELECVATWKEGSSRYLVGKVSHSHITSNEDRFRCFVYEKASSGSADAHEEFAFLGNRHEIADFRLAQSGDATCNGLFSPMEGSRTMTLKKVATPSKCKYPAWLTYFQHWHTLDYRKLYTLHGRNTTLRVTDNADVAATSGISSYFPDIGVADSGEIRLVCSEIKSMTAEQSRIIAHFTVGCQSGYVCLVFYWRDLHVIEVQSGEPTRRSEDACLPAHFNTSKLPFYTLVTTNPEPRECPYNGKYSISGVTQIERQKRDDSFVSRRHSFSLSRQRRQGNSEEICDEEGSVMAAGCDDADTMEFHSTCLRRQVVAAYSCHGRWSDNDTNFLITTPQSRTSLGAKRYCFIYREVNGIVQFSSSSHTCTRNISTGVEGLLAFNATSIGTYSTTVDQKLTTGPFDQLGILSKCLESNDASQKEMLNPLGIFFTLLLTLR